jgi:tRNA(Ile)-lysidine synthase
LTTPAPTSDWSAFLGAARADLDLRLDRRAHAPLAVAFSGGGDSLALLLAARAWARDCGREVLAMTVDHGLQRASADWALWCAARAGRLGVRHVTLAWTDGKPLSGVSAAARAARHRLIASAAREMGARVVLMGHTADDLAEARLMRAVQGVPSDPKVWAPSPAWPEGRGVFILRPLLGLRRATLREALRAAGESWIEDPANSDLRHARSRARHDLRGETVTPESAFIGAWALHDIPIVSATPGGEFLIDLTRLALTPRRRRLLSIALLCASGAARPPRGERVDRLLDRMVAGATLTASLAGARVQSDGRRVAIVREIGEARRTDRPMITLEPGAPTVWDGRFACLAHTPGLSVRPLDGVLRQLPASERARLKPASPAARRAMPVFLDPEGRVSCPVVAPDPRLEVRSLVAARLAGALGMIESEAAIVSRGETVEDILNGKSERDEASS